MRRVQAHEAECGLFPIQISEEGGGWWPLALSLDATNSQIGRRRQEVFWERKERDLLVCGLEDTRVLQRRSTLG